MSYTIGNFKDAVSRELHGRTLDKLGDAFETAYDAAQILLSELDPKETQRVAQISPQVFDDVDAYASESDFKAHIDILPSVGRKEGQEYESDFRMTGQKEYSIRKFMESPMLADRWINGTRFFLLRQFPRVGRVIALDTMDSATDWTAGGDASGLTTNALNYFSGIASLQVSLSYSAGSGYIEKTNLTSQDLTDFRLLGALFYKVYIPSGFSDRFSSFSLRWGNDTSSAYWTKTVTAAHDGTAFKDGWNLLRFDWSSATENATVDETAIDAVRLTATITSGADIPGVLFDDLNAQLGTMYDHHYYSSFLFRNSSGTWIEKPTDDDDIVNLSIDSYRIFVDIGALCALTETSGTEKDYERISKRVGWPVQTGDRFAGSLGRYKQRYPSERMQPSSVSYDFDS